MQVNLNNELQSVVRPPNQALKPGSTAAVRAEAAVSLEHSQALDAALAQTPEVRAEEVQQAKNLAASEHYPPQEIVQRLSRLLAIGLDQAPNLLENEQN